MIRLILKSLLLIFVLVLLLLPPNAFKKEKSHNINDVPGAVKMVTTLKSDSGKEIQVEYVKR
jgi:competence protein ComGC